MKLEPAHLEAVRAWYLRVWLAADVPHIGFVRQDLLEMSVEDLAILEDACWDLLSNDAPEVESYWAQFDDSLPYTVRIRGVPGAYVVTATEQDLEGPFSTFEVAQAWVMAHHTGIIV